MITATALGLCALGTGACVTSAAYKNKIESQHPPVGATVPVNGETVHVIQEGEAGPPVL
ncbi:MAG TPA: alpha/beta hydrolase, partial [Hyphomonas atlantica]|nr:alpha/beta hydrolase [Hyphomonas atlantica]